MISEKDKVNYELIRKNVKDLILETSSNFDKIENLVLDIAPQDHEGVKEFFIKSKIKTLDINPNSNCDYICDLCENNSDIIEDNLFDVVFCTEVLEHVSNPFNAVNELLRITKKGGVVVTSTPFNFRIHGPLPDNWRFTEHGLRELFKNFSEVNIIPLNDDDRFLMPIHYTLIAKK
jgi:SAM-dependent methyltransferase